METIKITKCFYEDHVARDLPAPAIVRETKAHYFIDANSEHLSELLSDAAFYADPWSYPDAEFGSWLAGLVRSAKATERAIENHLKGAA